MARIRTIKPEFFTSEDIVSLSPLARLLYIALWCEADRDGRLVWKPKTIKLRYMPGDDVDVTFLSQELIDGQMLVIYEVDGQTFAEIPSFRKHQIINNREAESLIPSREAHASTTRDSRVKAERKEGKEGKEGRVPDDASTSGSVPPLQQLAEAPPPFVSILLNDGSEHGITEAQVEEWSSTFPAVDVPQELREMRAWSKVNPTKRKTRRGIGAFVVAWLARAQDSGGGRRSSGATASESIFEGVR